MICLELLPCINCANYHGIKQPNGEERHEYVACGASKNHKAENVLQLSYGKAVCQYQKKLVE